VLTIASSYATMIRPNCTQKYCKLCHGGLKQIQQAGTDSARRRNIAIHNKQKLLAFRSTPFKSPSKKSKAPPQQRVGFLDLPSELRIEIYALCLAKANCHIYGLVEGGGYHPECCPTLAGTKFCLWASHRFPVAILLLNKAIYAEARQEIYRLIKFQLEPKSPAELRQIQYWLTKHPVRYATSLEIPFFVCPKSFKPTGIPLDRSQTPKMTRDHLVQLTRMISHMPNLRHLDIELFLSYQIRMQFLSPEKQDMMLCLLFLLRESLPTRIQLRVIVDREFYHNPRHTGTGVKQVNANIRLVESFLIRNEFQLLRGSVYSLGRQPKGFVWRLWGEKSELGHAGNRVELPP